MKRIVYVVLSALMVTACGNDEPSTASNPAPEKMQTPQIEPVVFDGISQDIKPGDNFFMHVNKKWMDSAEIADDQVGVGSYRFLNIPQQERLKGIVETVAQETHPKGSVEQKVGDFYTSGMNTSHIDERGTKPIEPMLGKIDAAKDVAELMAVVAEQVSVGNQSLLRLGVGADLKDSTVNIINVYQGGLGLPDRDYYFKEGERDKAIQQAYLDYLKALLELAGEDNAESKAKTVYALETELAKAHKTRVERRDVDKNYNKISLDALEKRFPNLAWTNLFSTIGVSVESANVGQPAYYDKLNELLSKTSLQDWKTYLKAHTLYNYASVLSTPFQDASFAYSKVISGQEKQQSRAKRMVRRIDRQLGFALGQLYVKQYFTEEAKKRATALVENLQKTMAKRIDALEWMSDTTKVKAKEKLAAIKNKVGYPDVWRTYNVEIDPNNFFENVVALQKEATAYSYAKVGKAPNKDEWFVSPGTVTAYYSPSKNEIVFPAGILQPPYFDLHADDAVNYGGIGMVIGHELTHAFDDQGARFDKDGNVSNWWTQEDFDKFKAKTQQVIDQYGKFTVLKDLRVNGALTVGENTADNGGLAIAFDAFKMTPQGKGNEKIGGFTPDQRFFLSTARIWRVKMRNAYMRSWIANDPHSPPIWRVNGPLMNLDPFYEAFDVKEGDANYRKEEERIRIW